MELAFVPKDESGWRSRGAPRRQVPPQIIDMLKHTGRTGEVGVIHTDGDTEEEVKEVLAALRAGGRQLGRRVRIQQDEQLIRFQLGSKL